LKPVLHLIQGTDASAADLLSHGMEAATRAYLQGYAREFEVHYYTPDVEDFSHRLGVRHHPLGLARSRPRALGWVVYNLRLWRAAGNMRGLVRSLGPNLPVLSMLRARAVGPLIVDFRYDWAETTRRHYGGWKRRLARPIQRRGLRAADLVITTTPALAAAARGVARRVVCIPNFVDRAVFHPRAPRRPVLLFAGRLHWAKGIDGLIRAFLALRAELPELELHLYGEGEEEAKLRALIPADAIAAVRFHGSRPQEELAAALGTAHVAVLPTLTSEGMPKSVLEAFASGTPVVATSVPGIVDLVDSGRTGTLVPPGDVAALTAGLRELLTDAARWSRYAQAGLDRARWFGGERIFRHQRRVMKLLSAAGSRSRR
jgi:glycosyltransferase involved in cell wall biosynthesis